MCLRRGGGGSHATWCWEVKSGDDTDSCSCGQVEATGDLHKNRFFVWWDQSLIAAGARDYERRRVQQEQTAL